MARTNRVLFERLTGNEQTATMRATPDRRSADEEAAAALMALGGFGCRQCHNTLSPANGYCCCHHAHCPYCGKWVDEWQGGCTHLVLEYSRQRWSFRALFRAFAQERQGRGHDEEAIWEDWERLLNLTAPARRLPGQRAAGYPRWDAEQIRQAYSPDVVPHLEAIFSPSLRQFSGEGIGPVMRGVLRPDVKTQVSDPYRHWRDCYFCADPLPGLARVEAFLTHLHEGTARLRALPPESMVRPPYDTPASLPTLTGA